jgi:hypothetical protein
MRSKGVYVNTLQITAPPGMAERKLVVVPAPVGFPLLAAWKLGIDSDDADVPGVRITAQLQVGPEGCADDPPRDPPVGITEIIDAFTYRAPFRPLQASQTTLPAPYELEAHECLYLFIKLTNHTTADDADSQPVPVAARANVFAQFVSEEEH